MKNIKRIATMLLALAMIMTCVLAGADTVKATEPGSITINGVSTENVYEIYQMLDLESYDTDKGTYSYKVNEEWADFFETEEAKKYFVIDSQNYATWIAAEDGETVATFAKGALSYAKASDIGPVKSSKNNGDMTITTNEETGKSTGKFTNLALGYYLIDSTMGALCGLTTTNPNASIDAKNGSPTIDKQVKEDSTGNWGGDNSADVGQIVEFRTTINVHAGAQNYVLHDAMSAGLTFEEVSLIEHVVPGNDTHTVGEDLYTVETEGLDDDCTFHVVFSNEFCNNLETNDKVIVYYEATVNEGAVVAGNGNPNEAWLDYGENHHTTHDTTTTKTYGFDIVKTDSQNKLINGAEFKIYDAATEGNEVKVVFDENKNIYVRNAAADGDETQEGATIVVEDGKVRVEGFDNGTYYLEETKTPAGYNKLSARQKFIISDGNLDATFNDDIFSTGSGVHVVNKSGTMLPETGGIGTTLFYAFGGMMAIGAVILLVTKKRMSNMA